MDGWMKSKGESENEIKRIFNLNVRKCLRKELRSLIEDFKN
jgi:hypothetical protein